jgi:hypothetical protein
MFAPKVNTFILAILIIGTSPVKTSAVTAEEAVKLIYQVDDLRRTVESTIETIVKTFQSNPTPPTTPTNQPLPDTLPNTPTEDFQPVPTSEVEH